jgi:hypothetical protein
MMTHIRRKRMFSERYFSKSALKKRRRDSITEAPCLLEPSRELEHQGLKGYLQEDRMILQDNRHSVKQMILTSICRSSRESFANIYSFLNLLIEPKSNLSQTLSPS